MAHKRTRRPTPEQAPRKVLPGLIVLAVVATAGLLLWRTPAPAPAARAEAAPSTAVTPDRAPTPTAAPAPAATAPAAPGTPAPEVAQAAPSVTADSLPEAGPADLATRELPPIPYVPYPAARPDDVVKATYEFAGRHPEILEHVPCFCGCERSGHGDNHDCFVAFRDDESGQLLWDTHAIGCGVCIDVAEDAMRMYNSGASVTAIQSTIDRKYSTPNGLRTPTPRIASQ